MFSKSCLIWVIFALTLFSCKSTNSDLQHVWGETSRDRGDFSYGECFNSENENFPASQNLLRETANYIMSKNQKVFTEGSNLDPDRFCFYIQNKKKFYAFTEVVKRAITVNTGLIDNMNSFEEFAFVIAHELAHVSMQHYLIFHPAYQPSDKFKELRKIFNLLINSEISANYASSNIELANCLKDNQSNNENRIEAYKITSSIFCRENNKNPGVCEPVPENYQEKYLSLHPEACKELALKNIQINLEFSKWNAVAVDHNKEDLFDEMVTETTKAEKIGDAGFNWMEQEADEVGAELYYRSGFDKSKILDFLIARALVDASLKTSKMTPQACIEFVNSSPNKDEIIATIDESLKRGKDTHPPACWRLLHLVYENILHRRDIQKTLQSDFSELSRLYDLFKLSKREILETN